VDKRLREAKLNPSPRFNFPKSRFDGKYYRKKMREIKRRLPLSGFGS